MDRKGTTSMTFTVGETVVYPHHGAALIEAIETRTIKGEDKIFFFKLYPPSSSRSPRAI